MKRVAVLQSNYIPWKGYFDLIHSVDEFVWYDDVQYTKHDWRNRNRIKTPRGVRWLTIPCQAHGKPRIDQVRIADPRWAEKHWRILTENYADAPFFARYRDDLEALYFGQRWEILADLNKGVLKELKDKLSEKEGAKKTTDEDMDKYARILKRTHVDEDEDRVMFE